MTKDAQEQFHAERLTGLGGSDMAVVLGLSKWKTPFQLWLEKTKRERDSSDSLQMRFGTYAEQFVASEYTAETGRQVQRYTPLLQHQTAPIIGHVDRLVIPEGQKRAAHQREIRTDRLLECKTASAYAVSGDEWGDPGTDAVPSYYLVQVATYMALTGCQWADLAVLFGNQRFSVYTVERDLELEAMLIEEASRWWQDHVVADVPPDPQSEAEARQRWANHQPGKVAEIDSDTTCRLRQYAELKANLRDLEKAEKALRDQIIPALTDAEIIEHAGVRLGTFKANKPSRRTDWKTLAHDLMERIDLEPDERDHLIEHNTLLSSGARVLRLTKNILSLPLEQAA